MRDSDVELLGGASVGPRMFTFDEQKLSKTPAKRELSTSALSIETKSLTSSQLAMRTSINSPISSSIPSLLYRFGHEEGWYIASSDIECEKEPFAQGACARVYRAKIRGTTVAMKEVLDRSNKILVKDLRNEIAVWRQTRHPNIVLFLGASFHITRGVQVLMEYMGGGDLETNIEEGVITRSKAAKICKQVAMALAWLHGNESPILHRDLKPANILLDRDGNAKLSDFGLSRMKPTGEYKMTGKTGTLRYMAPEVLLEKSYDSKVDVYSLGLIFYFAVTKAPPFMGYNRDKRHKFVQEHKNYTINPRFSLPSNVKQLIKNCTRFSPEERPTSTELVTQFERLERELGDQCCAIS